MNLKRQHHIIRGSQRDCLCLLSDLEGQGRAVRLGIPSGILGVPGDMRELVYIGDLKLKEKVVPGACQVSR